MSEPKNIYCPQCKRTVIHYDGRATTNQIARCKKCGKQVTYNPERDETSIGALPKRASSSGMTFY